MPTLAATVGNARACRLGRAIGAEVSQIEEDEEVVSLLSSSYGQLCFCRRVGGEERWLFSPKQSQGRSARFPPPAASQRVAGASLIMLWRFVCLTNFFSFGPHHPPNAVFSSEAPHLGKGQNSNYHIAYREMPLRPGRGLEKFRRKCGPGSTALHPFSTPTGVRFVPVGVQVIDNW